MLSRKLTHAFSSLNQSLPLYLLSVNETPAPVRFPGGSEGKELAWNAGDLGSIAGLGRFPGEGHGNPLQYPCLENPMDRGAWWATVHGVAKSRTWLNDQVALFISCDDLPYPPSAPPQPRGDSSTQLSLHLVPLSLTQLVNLDPNHLISTYAVSSYFLYLQPHLHAHHPPPRYQSQVNNTDLIILCS